MIWFDSWQFETSGHKYSIEIFIFYSISIHTLTGPQLTMLLLCFPPSVGDHGYNNSLSSMHPFLAATGPSFRQGYQISSLQSLDIYPLMCHLLSITPLPNNGTLTKARCLLAAENCGVAPLVIGLVVGILLVLTTITGKLDDYNGILMRYVCAS